MRVGRGFERRSPRALTVAVAFGLLALSGPARAVEGAPSAPAKSEPSLAAGAQTSSATAKAPRLLDIEEFRVEGASVLTREEVERVVYPFLGPLKEMEEIEKARAALEKAYVDRGYQTVVVAIPPQTVRNGVVVLRVTEGKVGRLRVHGARYYSPMDIKRQAKSLAEGTVPNFKAVMEDIVTLNQLADRRVTPALRTGAAPGTVDVDLNVQDSLPLHGSVEYNNRYSAGTTVHRVNVGVHYDNLWQLGHSLTLSSQLAPERLKDGEVFAASYQYRFAEISWLSLSGNATIQNSNVSTLGGSAVSGRGRIYGGRATFSIPGGTGVFHTLSTGIDYKLFFESLTLGEQATNTPLYYWPVTASYGMSLSKEGSHTELGASLVLNLRGLSSGPTRFDDKRYKALGDFIYYKVDLSRTDTLPGKLEVSERVNAQFSADPLIGPEELSAGGAQTVRGYMESQALGDLGALASVEVTSPPLTSGKTFSDLRVLVFTDGGVLKIHDALPDQVKIFRLWSAGAGTRVKLFEHVNGAVAVGVPFVPQGSTKRFGTRAHVQVSGEF